ncbi:hypothetical protein ACSW9V_15460 (plasmid) [Clostridium perfringens]|uniref:hypothetical protein n=1 Tax=Clostridium perfringens TaxID=1502 RepID=UPI000B368DFE|nr:hypothetical protein [Clostridium perfringens]EGT0691004.1 hypothetical protein [Clostridium perfringens]EGT0694190.1 hypothetical protein [Clostridium perfringens]EGT0697132.1 hypothetical protein [Clostridium perfringens]MDU3376284.1 hypothetical protein [Clostridium perfringens]MDU3536364.1 hypothetical protein [Clostridium perfringens]
MINANQLFKAGRTTKIFEVTDRLAVNDFYNTTGYKSSSVEGKMSRIKITIVDVSKGKKTNANVGEFNLTTVEWKHNFNYLLNIQNFKSRFQKNKGILNLTKANPHKKIGGSMIEVKTLKVSFEEGLRGGPKWKFEIITGQAVPKDDFGYDSKTYKETRKVNFFLDIAEVNEMVEYVSEYIALWKQSVFSQFLINRKAFINRASKNNFDEKTINTWNANPNSKLNSNLNSNHQQSSNFNNSMQNRTLEGDVESHSDNRNNGHNAQNVQYSCIDCGTPVDKETAKLIKKSFGKVLCSNCLANALK